MLWAWLAGAGAAGLLDAFGSTELAATALRREAVLVVVAGDLLLAVVAGLALRLARVRVPDAAALLAGASLAAVPPLSLWLGSVALGVAGAAVLAGSGLWAGRKLAFPRPLARALGCATLAGLAYAAALPPTLLPTLPHAPGAAADGRPDLLLLSIDTLRADALHGEPACTPNLTRLAAAGVTAEYALAPSSLTLPSHVTLLSGRALEAHGVVANDSVVPPLPWISLRLRGAGYRTAAVVSNYLLRADAGFGRGVEVYDDAPVAHAGPVERFRAGVARATWWGWLAGELPDASDRWLFGDRFGDDANRANARRTTDHALRLIRQLQAQPAPYYLFVHYMDPHDPYLPPPDSGCDAGRQRPAHAAAPEHADWRRLQRIARDLRSGEPSAEQARAQVKALYDGEVRYVDRALGELLEQVEHGGRPTIVLLTADHGEQFGDHGLMTHGDSVYEAGLRVPFMLAGPGVPVRRLSHPPHLIDVAPTLLALAGLDRSGLPGLDLSREIPTARPHLARAGPHAALRDAQGFKLLLELDGRGEPGRLYALGSDPAELHDLRRDQPRRFARLERELRSRARQSQPAPRDPGEEHLSALRALGYVE